MNQISNRRPTLVFAATLLLALGSAAAMAEDSSAAPKTRAQVRAELIEARATGTLPMGGEFAGVAGCSTGKSREAAHAEVQAPKAEKVQAGG